MMVNHGSGRAAHAAAWLPWVLGLALLGAVVVAAFHYSEERDFVRLAKRAEPAWLALAVLLQLGTYATQGGIWRRVTTVAGHSLPLGAAFELSLAKLFADQALPSGGLSSSILIARALARRDLPAATVQAAVLVNVASYQLAYVVGLSVALVIMAWRRQTSALVLITSALFLLFSLGVSGLVLGLAGRHHERLAHRLDRFPLLRRTVEFVAAADARLVRSPRVLAEAIGLQGGIMLLDAATVWALIRALGVRASAPGVYASFMVASLFRAMGLVPGGLGTFEATSVVTLRLVGVDLAVALSATLLFRGLSFWLPMLPGYWFSRRALSAGRAASGGSPGAPPGRRVQR
jgi:Mg2+-importing ATPase